MFISFILASSRSIACSRWAPAPGVEGECLGMEKKYRTPQEIEGDKAIKKYFMIKQYCGAECAVLGMDRVRAGCSIVRGL